MSNIQRSITMLIYGESKVGKSTLASTAPAPRLMLDVEGGHKFLPIKVKYWDPKSGDAPPVPDGTWDTCVVNVNDYATVLSAYQWLQAGKHQFNSLIVDSISELQVKCVDMIAGNEQMKMQQWGELLRSMGDLARKLRDLTTHPTKPLEAVIITAMAVTDKEDQRHPYLQGQLKTMIPYFYDIIGAITNETFSHPDPTQPPYQARRMYVERTAKYEAGERVQGRLGKIVEWQDLNIETMLDKIYGQREQQLQQTETGVTQ